MMFKRVTRIATGLTLAGLFFWWGVRHLDFEETRTAFDQVRMSMIGLAVGVFFVGYSCRIERWRLMLTQENTALSGKRCAGPFSARVATNNVLLFRAGDLLRGFGFNKRLEISAVTSPTALFVERLLDLSMEVSFLGIALLCFGAESLKLVDIGGGILLVAGFSIRIDTFFQSIIGGSNLDKIPEAVLDEKQHDEFQTIR